MRNAVYIICERRKGKKINAAICGIKCDKKCKAFTALNEGRVVQIEEVKPDPPSSTPDSEEEFRESETSVEVSEEVRGKVEAGELYQKAVGLRGTIETDFLELAAILRAMFANRFYYGHDTWKDFTENDELFEALKIGQRTDSYLRAVHEKYIEELGLSPKECARVGYTKLAIMLPVVDKKNVKGWLKEALGMTSNELSTKVRQETGRLSKDKPEPMDTMTFKVFPEQRITIERALELIALVANSDKKGHLLECMAADYLAGAEATGGRKEYVHNLIGRIEAVMKVKVESVTDRESGELFWG